jgi:amino acid adenylation domain-containing protein
MVAAILGIWGAGASYLPLDPAQPAARLAFQVDDADARVVVVSGADPGWAAGRTVLTWADLASPTGAPAPVAEAPAAAPPAAAPPAAAPVAEAPAAESPRGDAPAYVIYTSGSTGRPKGVVVSHANLANVVAGFARRLGTTAGTAVLWSTTVTFDISALELFLPLVSGGRVVIAESTGPARGRELSELIDKHDVAVVQGTPTLWRAVLPELGGALRGRVVLCGGEPLSADLAARLLRTGCRLFNAYGPTETTIWSTLAEVTGEPVDPVPVGTPIANTTVFVADAYGEELPCGVPGQLCIAGAGVSLGYLRRPDLTAQRFGTDPVRGRFYRTGDLARWRHDGVLEVLGRTDRQVKLRGHRIELGEDESVLREHERVTDAAALLSGDGQGEPALRVFVRQAPGAPVPDLPDRLWQHLRQRLPDYSLPSGIDVVAEFPTTANGKLDYQALGAMVPVGRGAARPAPAGDPGLTQRLVRLWREVLDRPDLDTDDNFFLQGGHSLLAERLVGRVSQLCGRVVSVRAIFDHPTARGLATFLAAGGGDDARR